MKRQLTVWIDIDLFKELKILSAKKDMSMTSIVEKMLTKLIKEYEPKETT